VPAELAAARAALSRTHLAGSAVTATGANAGRDDIRRYAHRDLLRVAVTALLTIALVLVLLLQSVLAPLYLLVTVIVSYAATIGVTNLLWHTLIGRPLDFTVPLLTFVILVAVGADYNIFLMARIREECPHASRAGVARAVASTGRVITAAGVIFAGSFVGLVVSPTPGLSETGFAIAFGVLLDTFVVRTLTVPALAALLGPHNWWPARVFEVVVPHPPEAHQLGLDPVRT
jgi:RND superfamily putative drug exporter